VKTDKFGTVAAGQRDISRIDGEGGPKGGSGICYISLGLLVYTLYEIHAAHHHLPRTQFRMQRDWPPTPRPTRSEQAVTAPYLRCATADQVCGLDKVFFVSTGQH